jgi:hypothetical protein
VAVVQVVAVVCQRQSMAVAVAVAVLLCDYGFLPHRWG